MKSDPNHRGLFRRTSVALFLAVAVVGLGLAAFNLGLYDAWVLNPRADSERREQAARSAEFAETQQISVFERKLSEELGGEDEETVVGRLGVPNEKRDVEYVSDGKTRPLWRYTHPPVRVSFCDGRVESVRVESLKGFPREYLGSESATIAQPRTERHLYPLRLGSKWEYALRDRGNPGKIVNIVTEVVASETNAGRTTATLVATSPGQAAREEMAMADERGVYRNGVSGLNSDREFPIIKYPAKSGDTWAENVRINNVDVEMTFVVGDAAEVKVAAGKFLAIPITTTATMNGGDTRSKKWFAEGVGIVKETLTVGYQTYTRELTKFTPGK